MKEWSYQRAKNSTTASALPHEQLKSNIPANMSQFHRVQQTYNKPMSSYRSQSSYLGGGNFFSMMNSAYDQDKNLTYKSKVNLYPSPVASPATLMGGSQPVVGSQALGGSQAVTTLVRHMPSPSGMGSSMSRHMSDRSRIGPSVGPLVSHQSGMGSSIVPLMPNQSGVVSPMPTLVSDQSAVGSTMPALVSNQNAMVSNPPVLASDQSGVATTVTTLAPNPSGMGSNVPTLTSNQSGVGSNVLTLAPNPIAMSSTVATHIANQSGVASPKPTFTPVQTGVVSGVATHITNQSAVAPTMPTLASNQSRVSYIDGGSREIYSFGMPVSRLQEKEELQKLNDRFTNYVTRVRQLNQQVNNVDTSAFLRSTKVLEDEIVHLKTMYENELEKMRNELEVYSQERTNLQAHNSRQQVIIGETQDRLSVEIEKTNKYLEDISMLQRKISSLEEEIRNAQLAAQIPQENVDQLTRNIENLSREMEQWKHRYEHEQVARQEGEDKVQQMVKKLEFSEQVNAQQMTDYQTRLDTSAATILSLEARIRELSTVDATMGEMLKQVRDTAETELKRYQIDSEELYSRNLAALKAQIDTDADALQRISQEKSNLVGNIGELSYKVRSLEGQVMNLQHQKQSLEEAVHNERTRAADNVHELEKRLRDVQDMLVIKMKEITNAQEANIPLKAEIEMLKALLEEEEKRLRVPLGIVPATVVQPSIPQTVTSSQIISSSSHNIQPSSLPPVISRTTVPAQQPLITGNTDPVYPPVPSPPLNTLYVPEVLRTPEEGDLAYDADYGAGFDNLDYDLTVQGVTFPMTGPRYSYESTPSLSQLQVQPVGPIQPQSEVQQSEEAKETTTKKTRNVRLVDTKLGNGKDYFDEMFHDLQQDTLFPKKRPNSCPVQRQMPSTYHDYTVSTSSAIGDLKILEVNQDGKYVRLVNDGPTEFEFGGYTIQQNVGGHPVAVYRFPPRTKFEPNATITVWSAINDAQVHNPPSEFFWKEQHKWGTGPECTTILCRANGQAVAWTTAAHRFAKDAFVEQYKDKVDYGKRNDESLMELKMDANGPKVDHVYLRREKQVPPTLNASKHPHGKSTSSQVHPQTSQPRALYYGNDNSSLNRQSRGQTNRPDPIPGQPYCGASAQRLGSAPLQRMGKCGGAQTSTIRGNGTLANKSAGSIRMAPPSPFLSPLEEQLIDEARDEAKQLIRNSS